MKVLRRVAIGAALWNSLFLVIVGLWLIPRMGTNPVLDRILLLTACFLPIVGASWSIVQPRSGAVVILVSVVVYLAFWAVSVIEEKAAGQRLGWDPRPVYMFVAPSSVIAVVILLTTRKGQIRTA